MYNIDHSLRFRTVQRTQSLPRVTCGAEWRLVDVLPVVYFIRIGGRDHYGNTAFGQSLRNFRSGLPVPKVEIDESKVRRTSFRKRHRTHTAGGPSDYFMTGRDNVFLKLHSEQWFILDDQHAERAVNHPDTLQRMEAR